MKKNLFQLTTLRRVLECGVYTFIFLLPWQTRWIWRDAFLNQSHWEYATLSIYATQLVLWGLIIIFARIVLRKGKVRLQWRVIHTALISQPSVRLYASIVILLAYIGVTVFFAYDTTVALSQWVVLVQAGVLMSSIIYLGLPLKRIALAWVGAGVVQAFLALVQFWQQVVVGNKWLGIAEHLPTVAGSIIVEDVHGRWLRSYGSFQHPNILGGFLTIALVLALYLLISSYNSSRRRIAIVALSITVLTLGLLVSFSRSAWFAVVVVVAMTILWILRTKHLYRFQIIALLLSAVCIPVVLFGATYSDAIGSRLWPQTDLEYNSLDLRVTFIEQARQVFSHHWLVGTGIGNYTHGVHAIVNNSWPGWYYQPVHNIFILPFVELGVIGGLLFLYSAVLVTRLCLQYRKSFNVFFVSLCAIVVAIIGIADHYFWTLYPGITMLLVILALLLQYTKSAPQTAHDA